VWVGLRSDFDMSLNRHTGFYEELMFFISDRLFSDKHPCSASSGMEVFIHNPMEAFTGMPSFRPFPEH
jgi:hypothetical protein